jgi:HPt (histidine-containing phosphotransfer) domain-containing protein
MSNDTETSILDLSTLYELEKLKLDGVPNFLVHMIQVYLNTSTELADKINFAIRDQNLSQLSHAAHGLKSSSASLGAIKLSEICLQLEMIADGASPMRDLSVLLKSFNQVFNATIFELKKVESFKQ